MKHLRVHMNSFKRVHAFQIELEFESVGFWGEGKTGVPGEKPLGAKERTNNKLNPHMASTPGFEPGPHWWEASALTTAPPLPWRESECLHFLSLCLLSLWLMRIADCLYCITCGKDYYYYSFKIFLRFWLAQLHWLILQNKLVLTKFGRGLWYLKWVQRCRVTGE